MDALPRAAHIETSRQSSHAQDHILIKKSVKIYFDFLLKRQSIHARLSRAEQVPDGENRPI
jgi:hypothetical protein